MKLEELKDNKKVKRWFRDTNAAQATRHNFLYAMQQYTNFLNMTPEELLDEAEQQGTLSSTKRDLKDHILDFREHLQQKGLSDGTVKNRITSIRSFYVSFEIPFPKIRGERSKTIVENDKIPTKEDLQDCLSVCDPLEKAVMLTGISSGLAANEVRNITLKQFKEGYDPETKICTLPLRRGKTEVDFVTFLSPEATKAIWKYLEYRDRPLKAVGSRRQAQVEKQRTTPESFLFIPKGVSSEYTKTHNEDCRKITADGMMKLYRNISDEARKNTAKGYNFIRSHTMRKYFYNTMHEAGCKYLNLEFMMGHALNNTQGAYYRPTLDELKTDYLKCYPYLTIQKDLDVSESPEYIKMKQENEVLAREAATATVEREELKRMHTEFEIQKMKHTIQILKLQRKVEPEHSEKINKMIAKLENSLDGMKDYSNEEFIDYTDQEF